MKKHLVFIVISIFTMTASLQSFAETLSDQYSAKEVQSLSGQSQSVHQKANQHFDDLQQVINEDQLDEDLLREMEARLKELRKQAAKRLEQKAEQKVPVRADAASEIDAKTALKSKELGKWWLRSALSYDPIPSKILNHLELSYSYKRMTGDFTLDKHLITTRFITRYKRFTNYLNYTFDKTTSAMADDYYDKNNDQIIVQNRDIRKDTKHFLTEEFSFAILKRFYAAAGFMYEEDDFISLDKRLTGYLGFGGRPIQTDRFTLKLFTALGHEEKDYTEEYHEYAREIPKDELKYLLPDYDPDTVKTDIFHCNQNVNWSITKNLSFNENFMYFVDIEDSDKYRWTLDLGLEFQFTKLLALTLNYNESMDNAINPLTGRKRNITIGSGVKVLF